MIRFIRWIFSFFEIIGSEPEIWKGTFHTLFEVIHVIASMDNSSFNDPLFNISNYNLSFPIANFFANDAELMNTMTNFGFNNKSAKKFRNISVTPLFFVHAYEEVSSFLFE